MTQNTSLQNNNDFTIKQFIVKTKNLWWVFLIVGFFFGTIGVLYAFFKKPIYQSTLTFALDDGGSETDMSTARSIASQLGLNIGSSATVFSDDNIIQILLSRRIIEKVLTSEEFFNNRKYKLIEFYLDKSGIRESAPEDSKFKNVHFNLNQDKSQYNYDQDSILYETYTDFTKNFIDVSRPDKKLNLFQVQVSSFDEKFSKVFTDLLVAETDSFYREICTKKSKETLEILEERVNGMKGNLHSSISAKATSTDANLNPAFSETTVPLQKEQVNIEVYGESYAEMFKNLEVAWFQYLKKIPLMQIIDHADYPMERIKPSKLLCGLIGAFIGFFLLMSTLLVRFIFRKES